MTSKVMEKLTLTRDTIREKKIWILENKAKHEVEYLKKLKKGADNSIVDHEKEIRKYWVEEFRMDVSNLELLPSYSTI